MLGEEQWKLPPQSTTLFDYISYLTALSSSDVSALCENWCVMTLTNDFSLAAQNTIAAILVARSRRIAHVDVVLREGSLSQQTMIDPLLGALAIHHSSVRSIRLNAVRRVNIDIEVFCWFIMAQVSLDSVLFENLSSAELSRIIAALSKHRESLRVLKFFLCSFTHVTNLEVLKSYRGLKQVCFWKCYGVEGLAHDNIFQGLTRRTRRTGSVVDTSFLLYETECS